MFYGLFPANNRFRKQDEMHIQTRRTGIIFQMHVVPYRWWYVCTVDFRSFCIDRLNTMVLSRILGLTHLPISATRSLCRALLGVPPIDKISRSSRRALSESGSNPAFWGGKHTAIQGQKYRPTIQLTNRPDFPRPGKTLSGCPDGRAYLNG